MFLLLKYTVHRSIKQYCNNCLNVTPRRHVNHTIIILEETVNTIFFSSIPLYPFIYNPVIRKSVVVKRVGYKEDNNYVF